jgi:hypothetical protein
MFWNLSSQSQLMSGTDSLLRYLSFRQASETQRRDNMSLSSFCVFSRYRRTADGWSLFCLPIQKTLKVSLLSLAPQNWIAKVDGCFCPLKSKEDARMFRNFSGQNQLIQIPGSLSLHSLSFPNDQGNGSMAVSRLCAYSKDLKYLSTFSSFSNPLWLG